MKLSNTCLLSLAALATSTTAAPAALDLAVPALAPENDIIERSAELDKRFGPIAILLIKVIGGQLVAGAAKAAIDAAKAHLEPEGSSFKDFDQARRAFTPEMAKDLYEKKAYAGIKGVACFNGPYSWSAGSHYEGPIDINFKWDIYHTDYDCFEIYSGYVENKGDGGYENIAFYGTCAYNKGTYRC
ncbi:hypothetical protein CKM354_000447900 [Cercospora kikuchii]|uniref:DUF7888 domain-containing protein n=1 Tax=Cercospora kikuchii TaxID=84275 RepID=A0A9P3CDY4_9PEZI|nr:uncharacterized protein CKM354_000447900 [Cercospora kikuchii]GIZ41164.1 hypothetical protein CKM354_000447900 [Cercospora kikuchii]